MRSSCASAEPFWNGDDLVEMAQIRGHREMEALIESRRPPVRRPHHLGSPLVHAVIRGDVDGVRSLLASGRRSERAGRVQRAARARVVLRGVRAAARGHEPIVRLMLHHRPRIIDRVGVTALHRFARQGEIDNAAVFLGHGANLQARDEEFCTTPLGYAALHGRRQMVEFLLKCGAKPTLPDDLPWATPTALARYRRHDEIVRLLSPHDESHHSSRADDVSSLAQPPTGRSVGIECLGFGGVRYACHVSRED